MARLDQYIRFVAQGIPLIMSLATKSAKNEWVLKPEKPEETTPEDLNSLMQLLTPHALVRIENNTLIMDAGWDDQHIVTDGIVLRPNWDGLTLDGLLSATACLIAHSLSLLVNAFGTCHFRRSDGKKIQYRQFDNWRAVHLMRPDWYLDWIDDELSEEDQALLRLYNHLGLTQFDEDEDDDWEDDYDDLYTSDFEDEDDTEDFMDNFEDEDPWGEFWEELTQDESGGCPLLEMIESAHQAGLLLPSWAEDIGRQTGIIEE